MITPEELANIRKQEREDTFAKEMKEFEEVLIEKAKKGMKKAHVPAPKIEGLFYYDERQEAFASYLVDRGFKVRKEVEIIGGVRQEPEWYLYIY